MHGAVLQKKVHFFQVLIAMQIFHEVQCREKYCALCALEGGARYGQNKNTVGREKGTAVSRSPSFAVLKTK